MIVRAYAIGEYNDLGRRIGRVSPGSGLSEFASAARFEIATNESLRNNRGRITYGFKTRGFIGFADRSMIEPPTDLPNLDPLYTKTFERLRSRIRVRAAETLAIY
jgi:hypothetical protein